MHVTENVTNIYKIDFRAYTATYVPYFVCRNNRLIQPVIIPPLQRVRIARNRSKFLPSNFTAS
jgi:hypothetical protein